MHKVVDNHAALVNKAAAFLAARREAPAQVVKLVDTLDSGSSVGNNMEVRVLSWATKIAPKPSAEVRKPLKSLSFSRVERPKKATEECGQQKVSHILTHTKK